jgi:5'(3')-deoxyribonucleotidase
MVACISYFKVFGLAIFCLSVRFTLQLSDGIHNLLGGKYKKLLMSAPYNKKFNAEENGMVRVNNWVEIYEAISEMYI